MTHLRKLILSGAALTIAATGLAVAQTPEPPAAPAAPEAAAPADATGTGRAERRNRSVSEEDFGARRMERIAAADTDGDGEISRAEIEAHVLQQMVQRRADRMERRLDVDGDGTITLAEIENQQAKRFAYLDRNEDGTLDRGEMRRAKSEMRDRDHRGPRHGGHHREMREDRGGPRN